MPPVPMPSQVNGHANVPDLGALKARADQRKQLTAQLLTQAGLLCGCGERIRDVPVIYYTLGEAMVDTQHGKQPALKLGQLTVCSRACTHAQALEATAIARRDGPAGRVTWLDERRAARAARE